MNGNNSDEPKPMRELITNAIQYWERKRILYNVILIILVISLYIHNLPSSRQAISIDLILNLFVFTVMANIVYCSAYVVDLLAQFSDFQSKWIQYRWALFTIGVMFASTLARFIAIGLFTTPN